MACSYGWFVRAFQQFGYDAMGVELDWAACEIGRLVYGLSTNIITRSEIVGFLRADSRQYDVTSCFSLLHHFVLGKAAISAEQMLQLLDKKTRVVLFIDMGEEHEEWYRTTLKGWSPAHIERWIKANSTFKQVRRLGRDQDDQGSFSGNYGRTLFACMR